MKTHKYKQKGFTWTFSQTLLTLNLWLRYVQKRTHYGCSGIQLAQFEAPLCCLQTFDCTLDRYQMAVHLGTNQQTHNLFWSLMAWQGCEKEHKKIKFFIKFGKLPRQIAQLPQSCGLGYFQFQCSKLIWWDETFLHCAGSTVAWV